MTSFRTVLRLTAILVSVVFFGATTSFAEDLGPAIGTKAPDIGTRLDQFGKPRQLSDLMGRNGLVLFFFRSAASPGRTAARSCSLTRGLSQTVCRVGLGWSDIDCNTGMVRWRGGQDKIKYEHVTPLTTTARTVLEQTQRERGAIGDAWVFPSPTNPERSISRHLLRDWWQRGEQLAQLDPEPRRGWHSLRRKFATELKATPLVDLCALGGWKEPQTVLKCYQRPDAATMRAALDRRQRLA